MNLSRYSFNRILFFAVAGWLFAIAPTLALAADGNAAAATELLANQLNAERQRGLRTSDNFQPRDRDALYGVVLTRMPAAVGSPSYSGAFTNFGDTATIIFWRESIDNKERLFVKVDSPKWASYNNGFWFCPGGSSFSVVQNGIDYGSAFRVTRGNDTSVCENLNTSEIFLVDQWSVNTNFVEAGAFVISYKDKSSYYSGSINVSASQGSQALPPACTLTATPPSVSAGSTSILTATCSPAATSYLWVGGSCASTSASCSVTPTATTTYTVAGRNASGSGSVAAATVTVATTAAVQVIEFYNANLDNYFITADAGEAAAIDGGAAGPGWSRTSNTFKSGGASQVCRFYGSALGPNSHFYTADAGECAYLKSIYNPAAKSWKFESNDFLTSVPANGMCPSGTVPVYRAYNNGATRGVDSNHRITTNLTAINQQVANCGWKNEGVVMCAPSGTTSGGATTCGNPLPSAVTGSCGSSNGNAFNAAPTTNLCTAGTPSSVSGTGPWSWTCQGSNGGTNASCSANKQSSGSAGLPGARPAHIRPDHNMANDATDCLNVSKIPTGYKYINMCPYDISFAFVVDSDLNRGSGGPTGGTSGGSYTWQPFYHNNEPHTYIACRLGQLRSSYVNGILSCK